MATGILQIGDVTVLPSANDGLAVASLILTLGQPLVRTSWPTSLPAIVRYFPLPLGLVADNVSVSLPGVKFAAGGYGGAGRGSVSDRKAGFGPVIRLNRAVAGRHHSAGHMGCLVPDGPAGHPAGPLELRHRTPHFRRPFGLWSGCADSRLGRQSGGG